VTPAAALSLLS